MRLVIGSALILVGLFSVSAASEEVLTNADVVAMVKGRLRVDIVVQKIEQSSTAFDLTTNALLELKKAGVPDVVVSKMLKRRVGKPSAPASTSTDAESPTEPSAEEQYNFGVAYANGTGVPKDLVKAVAWFRKAADQGHARAQYFLGVAYANGTACPQKDPTRAAVWYRKAAEQGLAEAQYNLGVAYYEGEGVPKDLEQAAEWYRRAADQGDAAAQHNLGRLYAMGEGVSKDHTQAANWYRKAAEQGLAEAQLKLALLYANGTGVPEDQAQAVAWFRKAADQGDAARSSNSGRSTSPGQESRRIWR